MYFSSPSLALYVPTISSYITHHALLWIIRPTYLSSRGTTPCYTPITVYPMYSTAPISWPKHDWRTVRSLKMSDNMQDYKSKKNTQNKTRVHIKSMYNSALYYIMKTIQRGIKDKYFISKNIIRHNVNLKVSYLKKWVMRICFWAPSFNLQQSYARAWKVIGL